VRLVGYLKENKGVYINLMCLDNSTVKRGLPADGDDYRRNA